MDSASEGDEDRRRQAPGPELNEAPRALTEADLGRAISAISRAFAWHEPWGEWTLPDEPDRERKLARMVEEDLRERFLPEGESWTIAGASVTLWMPPGKPAFQRRRSEADYAVYGERAELVREADRMIAAMKPEGGHWFLDTIATEPESMGRGCGARLLDHDLAVRDLAGHACALDTHTQRNVDFYARRGFEVIASNTLPASDISLFMMYRAPR